MEEEGHQVRLPKLAPGGANWTMYRDRLIWAMQDHSIDDHITSDTPPTAYAALGTVNNLTPAARWAKEENAIKKLLSETLPDTAFAKVKTSNSIKAAWEVLKRLYEEWSKALIADVVRKFRNKRCGENESVRTHFEALADLREQLAAMGKVVSDDDYTDTLIASLPASYNNSVSSISASVRLGSTALTADIFEHFIIDEYERIQVQDKLSEPKDEALTADSSKKNTKEKDKHRVECFNCKKKGHYKSECWAKGGGKEGQGPKRSKGKEDAASAEDKKEPEAWATIEDAQEPASETRPNTAAAAVGRTPARAEHARSSTELYDSGASKHMSPFSRPLHLIPGNPPTSNHSC
jgi:hypothetical protein